MNAPRPTRAHVRELLQIVRQYGDLVRWVARSQGVHESALDDVVQDTFLGILRRLPDRDPAVPLRAWVMGVARNAAFSHERGAARYGLRLRALAPGEPPTTPEHQVQERQAWSLLRQFLDRLPAEQREVFVLCEIHGEAAADVARLMGCSVNTVHSRLRLARARFHERFSDPARAKPMIDCAKWQAAAEPKANACLVAVLLADLPASSRWGLGLSLGGGGAGSWGLVAAGAAALVVVGAVPGDQAPRALDPPRPGESRTAVEVGVKDSPAGAAERATRVDPAPAPAGRRVSSKHEREELRRRILAAMQSREAAAAERDGAASKGEREREGKAGEPVPPRANAERPDDGSPTPGNLIDRTGNHPHMTKVMNEELMPLVDECYALARETQPGLMSMLVLDVDLLGDEELGGVVESVRVGEGNEVADPALVECVQESLLSTTLPPPPEGGRESIQLQIRPDPPAADPPAE